MFKWPKKMSFGASENNIVCPKDEVIGMGGGATQKS